MKFECRCGYNPELKKNIHAEPQYCIDYLRMQIVNQRFDFTRRLDVLEACAWRQQT